MISLPVPTIPSAFIRQDDATTAADRFINVRDLQLLRLNHNKLLAHAVRSVLFSIGGPVKSFSSIKPPARGFGPPLFPPFPVSISPYVSQVCVVCNAYCVAAPPPNVSLFPFISTPNRSTSYLELDETKVMTVNNAAEATYTVTIDVPRSTERYRSTFTLYASTPLDAAEEAGVEDVEDCGSDWFDVSTVGWGTLGHIVFFSTLGMGPRILRATYTLPAGAGERWWIDRPFDVLPVPKSTLVTTFSSQSVAITSMTAYELQPSAF